MQKQSYLLIVEMVVKTVLCIITVMLLAYCDGRASIFFYLLIGIFFFTLFVKVSFRDILDYFVKNKIFCIVLTLSMTFAMVGNKTLIYPVNGISLIKILLYILFFLLFLTPVISILKICDCLASTHTNDLLPNQSRKNYFIILFIGFLIIESIYQIAFIPGVVSWDDYIVIAEAKGLCPIREYEGLFYIYTRYILLNLFDNITFVAYVQIIYAGVIFSITTSWIISVLDQNINYKILLVISFAISAFPNNALMTITLTKDSFWAISYVWLVYCVIRISTGQTSKIIFGEYVVSLCLVWLIRQNGWLVVPIVLFSLTLFIRKNLRSSIIISNIIAVCMIFSAEAGLRSIEYESTPPGMKYIAAFQDLLGVYYNQGHLDEDTKKMIEGVISDDFESIYNPYWAEYETWKEPLGEINTARFLKNYITTFLHNPVKLIKSVLLRQDMLWDIQCGVEGTETWQWWTEFVSDRWANLIPERKENILTQIVDSIGKFTVRSGLKEFLWRCGIPLQICIFCIVSTIKKRRNFLRYMPLFGLLLFYLLGLGWEHYRYFWCVNLTSMLYLSAHLCENLELFNYENSKL